MAVIKLKPALKDIIWGGNRMRNEFGYDSDGAAIAEAWVVSAHPSGESVAEGGRFDGMPLSAVLAQNPGFTGGKCPPGEAFPLLVKFIDAARDLSIQVHPDDAYAAAHEGGYGKTEMWYVMDAAPGAAIYYGFRRRVTPAEFSAAVADGTVCEILRRVPCKKGDVFFIPARTVHAIGAGLLICEIQQSSDITYRVFDYNRPGADGKPRQLHVKQASECARLAPAEGDGKPAGSPETENGLVKTLLAECKYFTSARVVCAAEGSDSCPEDSFTLLTVLDGSAELECGGELTKIKKGDGIFISADSGSYTLRGKTEYIKTTL